MTVAKINGNSPITLAPATIRAKIPAELPASNKVLINTHTMRSDDLR